MTHRFATALAGAVALGTAAAAATGCGPGGGPLVTTASGASSGRDDPGSTRDTPPAARDNPASDCIQCNVEYQCTSPGSPNNGMGIELRTSDGTCTQQLIDLVCSGSLFKAPACTGGGGGPFRCGNTTCTPAISQPTPQPQPGQGGSSGSTSSGGTANTGGIGVDAG